MIRLWQISGLIAVMTAAPVSFAMDVNDGCVPELETGPLYVRQAKDILSFMIASGNVYRILAVHTTTKAELLAILQLTNAYTLPPPSYGPLIKRFKPTHRHYRQVTAWTSHRPDVVETN